MSCEYNGNELWKNERWRKNSETRRETLWKLEKTIEGLRKRLAPGDRNKGTIENFSYGKPTENLLNTWENWSNTSDNLHQNKWKAWAKLLYGKFRKTEGQPKESLKSTGNKLSNADAHMEIVVELCLAERLSLNVGFPQFLGAREGFGKVHEADRRNFPPIFVRKRLEDADLWPKKQKLTTKSILAISMWG